MYCTKPCNKNCQHKNVPRKVQYWCRSKESLDNAIKSFGPGKKCVVEHYCYKGYYKYTEITEIKDLNFISIVSNADRYDEAINQIA